MIKQVMQLKLLVLCLGLSACQFWSTAEPVPVTSTVQSQLYPSPVAARFSQTAAAAARQLELSRSQQQWPGMTAAVAWRGQLLWAGAAGYADLASQQSMTIASQFRLGSTSKAVTATALARAVASGLVELDTPIEHYKADLPNPAWQQMTLRQLMSHTAGFPGYDGNTDRIGSIRSWLKWAEFTDVDQALALFDDSELIAPPGQRFHYSSFDINLASSVLQSAAKQPFLDYLQQHVSKPLGLNSLAAADQSHPQQVSFYETSSGVAKLHRPVNLSQKWAAGGLAASSVDLVRLGSSWLDPDFIPASIQQMFWTVQPLADGSANEEFYALGWRHFQHNFLYCDRENQLSQVVSYIHHGGVSDGAQSLLVIYPKWQLVVAVNINTQTQNWCDFAREVSLLTKPFLHQIAPELLPAGA
jgi:serine beta-lactamase-like protein LACTB, mitochondrial